MKCVVGVELAGQSDSALALLGRLKFSLDQTILVHCSEPISVTMAASAFGMLVEGTEILEDIHKAGHDALASAKRKATEFGLNPATQLCEGPTALTLMDAAEADKVDLIAVASTVRGTAGAIFGGSVARALAVSAKQSVLIAREEPPNRPLNVLFATDQSPYCAACVRLLAHFAPKGIANLTLLTVLEKAKFEGLISRLHHVDLDASLAQVDERLSEQGKTAAEWLTEKGIPSTSVIKSGRVEETIHDTMVETKADLLIVGSHGHGFMERMLLGSTALHEVVNETYPVLLLRPSDVSCVSA